ncbi:MAG: DUF512 domain-containing protein [Peptococcaceae bacterium]|nr:DUF512 domain-containing protein [Peptococcaceae bacterium]
MKSLDKANGLIILDTVPGSIAEEMGLEQGDLLLSINGIIIKDILDYQFYSTESYVTINIEKKNGDFWELEIENDDEQDLGIIFSVTGLEKISRCKNKCIFCFVDQMPKGLRKTLYVKDDDYRLSFTQGSFVTLSNLTHDDLLRIIRLKLSPLFVSVHTTNPKLRAEMMGNKNAGQILSQLETLTNAGIEINAQAVIVPGINDGNELDRTIEDLIGLWPGVRNLAVVPVGLTGFRKNLVKLEKFNKNQAGEVVAKVKAWQNHCLKSKDYPFVFASDEFYFTADKKIPSGSRYADYPQIENGVGLTRIFLDQWKAIKKIIPLRVEKKIKVVMVTGMLGRTIIEPIVSKLNEVHNLQVSLLTVENSFFGPTVTAAGLLSGSDILIHQAELSQYQLVILPANMFKADSRITLDDITLEKLEKGIGTKVSVAEGPREIINTILEITGG